MKVKAQVERTKRLESDRKVLNLQVENTWLRNMVNFQNFGGMPRGQFGMQVPSNNFAYAPPPAPA